MDRNNLPQEIFGIHDRGAEHFFTDAGKKGWIVVTCKARDMENQFADLANAGHGVIVRLNWGYGSEGTLPMPAQYGEFAAQCAAFVAGSSGAHIWMIGNETNTGMERPGNDNGNGGDPITPEKYGDCFARVRAAIKGTAGHADDWVIPSAPGPWNPQTGDYVDYFRDMLNACMRHNAKPDALALHTYSNHDVPMDAALVTSEEMNGGHHWQFRTYRDFLSVVPASLRGLPVFITESQHLGWENRDVGWIQAAYAEINGWNANHANQPIQALVLFRWQHNPGDPEGWGMSNKDHLLGDFRAALQNTFPVRWAEGAPPSTGTKPTTGTTPVVAPPPPTDILPLAKARWFVEETMRQLEANNAPAAQSLLTGTVIPWFYATAREHSDNLPNAQAHTAARWWCEEAARRIEQGKPGEVHDILRDQVLTWLNSAGPSSIGILGIEEPEAKPARKRVTRKKKATKGRTTKRTVKKSSRRKRAV